MKIITFILFLLSFSLFGGDIITGRALWIDDGDTFWMVTKDKAAVKIRMWGIDAPEKDQPGGKEATMALIQMIGRKQIKVETFGLDRYKSRTMGRVYLGALDVNLEMVATGNAWWYRQYAPKATDIQAAEIKARAAKLGIWSAPIVLPPWDWRHHPEKREVLLSAAVKTP